MRTFWNIRTFLESEDVFGKLGHFCKVRTFRKSKDIYWKLGHLWNLRKFLENNNIFRRMRAFLEIKDKRERLGYTCGKCRHFWETGTFFDKFWHFWKIRTFQRVRAYRYSWKLWTFFRNWDILGGWWNSFWNFWEMRTLLKSKGISKSEEICKIIRHSWKVRAFLGSEDVSALCPSIWGLYFLTLFHLNNF